MRCWILGHRWRLLVSMPGFWKSDPDMFNIQKCRRCGKTRMVPPGWDGTVPPGWDRTPPAAPGVTEGGVDFT